MAPLGSRVWSVTRDTTLGNMVTRCMCTGVHMANNNNVISNGYVMLYCVNNNCNGRIVIWLIGEYLNNVNYMVQVFLKKNRPLTLQLSVGH